MIWTYVASALAVTGGAATSEFPAIVAVGTDSDLGPNVVCTGVLVDVRAVVVAANCVEVLQASRATAAVWFGPVAANGTSAATADLHLHPDYTGVGVGDVGLVVLAADAPVAPMAVRPTLLPDASDAVLVGYGTTDDAASDAGTRRAGDVTVTAHDVWTLYTYDPDVNSCFGDGVLVERVGAQAWAVGVVAYAYSDTNDATPSTVCAGGSSGSTRLDAAQAWLGDYATLDTTLDEADTDTDADSDADTDADADADTDADADADADADGDADTDSGVAVDEGGCGCAARGGASAWLAGFAAWGAARRRRAR